MGVESLVTVMTPETYHRAAKPDDWGETDIVILKQLYDAADSIQSGDMITGIEKSRLKQPRDHGPR